MGGGRGRRGKKEENSRLGFFPKLLGGEKKRGK